MLTLTLTPAQQAIMREHPCFDEAAHARIGRVHLPVAAGCNIQCGFCERRICANLTMQHPGWARQRLNVDQALERVDRLVHEHPAEPFVVGIAGPGEPLASQATFETLERLRQRHPALTLCISTNGLLLSEALPRLCALGVKALTVTVNAPDATIGQLIYRWVRHQGRLYRGAEAAERLVEQQFRGIRAAVAAGLVVKANTVLMPEINGPHLERLALRLREAGVSLMNLMPLIPGGSMATAEAPSCEVLRAAQDLCARTLPQFRLCEHCRADVIAFPHRTLD